MLEQVEQFGKLSFNLRQYIVTYHDKYIYPIYCRPIVVHSQRMNPNLKHLEPFESYVAIFIKHRMLHLYIQQYTLLLQCCSSMTVIDRHSHFQLRPVHHVSSQQGSSFLGNLTILKIDLCQILNAKSEGDGTRSQVKTYI